ncbi:unnamed protein product [Toxocara canis]|uniref:WD_REPEATS_REGION domain-containing protein n=1 Tax=Toxocara canis TaxID=6265 RepID=A0A183UZI6_TOXCA|nr:unnamed protein product [Toxocara canis]
MGTVSAIVVVCVLLISAAVTLILILVTVPSDSEDPNEQPSTFQPYSHTNRAYEIHLPTRHSSPSPVDNNSSVSAVHNETISPLDSPSIAGPEMVLNSLNSTAIKTPSEEPEASIITQKPKMIASEHSTTTVKPLTASKFIAKTTTTSSLLQVTGEIATTRKRDFVTLTLRYESKLQHAELKSKARKIDMDGVETSKLELEREVGLPPEHKIIGIAFEHELLYVGTTDGKIRVWNPTTGEQVISSPSSIMKVSKF